jgi:hypothetical protein
MKAILGNDWAVAVLEFMAFYAHNCGFLGKDAAILRVLPFFWHCHLRLHDTLGDVLGQCTVSMLLFINWCAHLINNNNLKVRTLFRNQT